MNYGPLQTYASMYGADAYFERWWALGESFRYLRIKGGLYYFNNGKVG